MQKVLDNGYVKLINNMGSDIDVVNAARASFEKEVSEMSEGDDKLLRFLIQHKHDSTMRHCAMTFEVYAPLMVARQWYKHSVASTHLDDQMGWNESSRRYITENEVFYIPEPEQWRSMPENKKQGSGGPVDEETGKKFEELMNRTVELGLANYREALSANIAPEQARLLLPAYSMYVRWRWTTSLNSVLHFLSLRLKNDSQFEIREYAKAILSQIEDIYPKSIEYWMEHRVN
jgi:thymidylate synthase (FAD)